MPISAVDSITPAIEHTRQQLFRPFRIGQWTRLAFVGLLAGELGSGGFNRSNLNFPHRAGAAPHISLPGHGLAALGIEPALLAALITSLVISALTIGIVYMYISSVMRFVLFDSVVTRECHIRASWSRRLTPGWRYFVWKLLYGFFTLAVLVVLVGIPAAFAYAKGWFHQPREHLAPFVLVGFILFLILCFFLLVTAVIFVLTKDFVIPQMALENFGVVEAWRRLWAMIEAELGAYAVYILMKIVLAIVVGILMSIAAVILGLFFAIPAAGLSILAILTGKSAGLTWNVYTITLAVVVGCILLAIFGYLVSLVFVPAIVFFPAYSMYFFAARYPRLAVALYPASSPAPFPAGAAPASP